MQNQTRSRNNNRGGRRRNGGNRNYRGNNRSVGGVKYDHFYCFPLWDILAHKLADYQTLLRKFINENYPEFKYTYKFQSTKTAHLTLSMLDLSKADHKVEAVKILEVEIQDLLNRLGPIEMSFEKLATFKDIRDKSRNPSLYFLEPKEDEHFQKFKMVSDFLICRCTELGIIDLKKKGANYRFHRSALKCSEDPETGLLKFPENEIYLDEIRKGKDIPETTPTLPEGYEVKIHSYPHVTLLTGCRQPKQYEEIRRRSADELGGVDHVEQYWKPILQAREDTICWRDMIAEFNVTHAEELLKFQQIRLTSVDLSIRDGYPSSGGYHHAAKAKLN